MTFSRTLVACTLTLTVLAAAAAPAAAVRRASRPSCMPADAHLLDANGRVSVFWRYGKRSGGRDAARWRSLYTCARGEKQPRRIGMYGWPPEPLADTGGIEQVRLAGRYIAYEAGFNCSRYTSDCELRVVIRDAIRGSAVTTRRFLMFDDPSTHEDWLGIPTLLLTRTGSAVLLMRNGVQYEVWSMRRGAATLLDHGPDIDIHSLAISANRAYWVNADSIASAPLE